jgi:arylsulfatase A-like enzyme
MKRRDFIKTTTSSVMTFSALQSAFAQDGKKPNVLFVAVDDLNDWIHCLGGHPDCKTPNIDRLANRGVLFTKAYCSAPACNPSRASLLTGVRPSTSGVYLNSQPWKPAMPDVITMPKLFREHGYHVVGGGKIYHDSFKDGETAWHEYVSRTKDPVPPNTPVNGIPNTAHFDWGAMDVADEDMDDYKIVEWAKDYLSQDHDKPFFLACGLFRPHLPWYVPRKYHEMFPPDQVTLPNVKEDDLEDVPQAGKKMANPGKDHKHVTEANQWRQAVSGYLASIAFADTMIGRLLDGLEQSQYADNTIIVFWGDHGWHLGEKLHWRKFALWEEATRCPLIISVPHSQHNGERCNRTVTLLDVYPTLTALCGLDNPDTVEGNDLTPLLNDPETEWKYPSLTTEGRNNHSIRSERWRYIRYADGSEELYDHENDEMEWKNLAGDKQYASVIKELAAWLPKINAPDAEKE